MNIGKIIAGIAAAALMTGMLTGFDSAKAASTSAEEGRMAESTAAYPDVRNIEAVFLGIENYGKEEVCKENADQFRYRFQWDGKEESFQIGIGEKGEDGDGTYPIQNLLKQNYRYRLTVQDGMVTEAEEIRETEREYIPVVSGVPGKRTLENFLRTALEPVGTTLYVFGGGWDWQDTGTAHQARSIGVSPDWVRFFEQQDENYTYKNKDDLEENRNPETSYYPFGGYNMYYYAGLDCSGYVGWCVYNTLRAEDDGEGFVGSATRMAKRFAENGYGKWTQDVPVPDGSAETVMKPGDIMSMNGHVWISLGTCADGSVVIVHSTPSYSRTGQPGGGVQIGAIGTDETCEAYVLADRYMSEYFPEWYRRYPAALKSPELYFTIKGDYAGKFSWAVEGESAFLTDPEGYQNCSADEVLKRLFAESAV